MPEANQGVFLMMKAFIPPQYAADAVPEKRTQDEEQMPPAAVQTDEMLRRVEEQAKTEKEPEKANKNQEAGEGSSAEPGEQPKAQQKAKDESEKRSRMKSNWERKYGFKRGAHTEVKVFNMKGDGLQVGDIYNINTTTYVGGAANSQTKRKDTPPEKRDRSHHPDLPRKLFNSLDTVTKEDCIHVSEYSSCEWEELGELLFLEETSRLEQYRAEMEKKTRKKAVQMILEEWRNFAGKNALVLRLSEQLLKLNEIEALKRLAKRHKLA